MLGVEPQTSTTRPTWQVTMEGVKVCAQQSMSNHMQFSSG